MVITVTVTIPVRRTLYFHLLSRLKFQTKLNNISVEKSFFIRCTMLLEIKTLNVTTLSCFTVFRTL